MPDVASRAQPIVPRFDEREVRASTARARIARAVTAALKSFDGEREAIAAEMSAYLGERVSKGMLDQYASQASELHAIPAHRLVALAVITGDARLVNAALADSGLIAIAAKYEPLLARELAREEIERLRQAAAAHDARWRAAR